MIKNETTVNVYQMEQSYKKLALEATISLHYQIREDDSFSGYESTIEQFDRLYKEVYAITRYELFDGADCEQIVETWFAYFEEILNGERELEWFEYV
jgi:hypothetical protein